jgi:1,4-dihydroxy-2-naphthoyl-CoA synthase
MTQDRAEADTVAFSVEDGIAWVWFNRPEKRNCMSPKLNRRMKQVLEELEFRDDVKVLVLTGEGEAWTSRNTSAKPRNRASARSARASARAMAGSSGCAGTKSRPWR